MVPSTVHQKVTAKCTEFHAALAIPGRSQKGQHIYGRACTSWQTRQDFTHPMAYSSQRNYCRCSDKQSIQKWSDLSKTSTAQIMPPKHAHTYPDFSMQSSSAGSDQVSPLPGCAFLVAASGSTDAAGQREYRPAHRAPALALGRNP